MTCFVKTARGQEELTTRSGRLGARARRLLILADGQRTLDELTRANINDPAFNRLENGTLRLVKVFDWFGGDWGNDAAKLAFVLRYADDELRGRIESRQGGVRIRYTDWDWSLNDVSKEREK